MIPYDPILLALVGALCAIVGGAAFTMGDLHGEARTLRGLLASRTSEERRPTR